MEQFDENETGDDWTEDDGELTALTISSIALACCIALMFAMYVRELM